MPVGCQCHGARTGGRVRVGLEDNLLYDWNRTELADNVRLMSCIARIGCEIKREPASPAETKEIVGLCSGSLAVVKALLAGVYAAWQMLERH
jgi:uncharacterized protein (DUF849 family)